MFFVFVQRAQSHNSQLQLARQVIIYPDAGSVLEN